MENRIPPATGQLPRAPRQRGTALWWSILLGLVIVLVIRDMQRDHGDAPLDRTVPVPDTSASTS